VGATPGAVLTGWLFALCPVLWMWTGAGLETPLVLLIQMLTWWEVGQIEEPRGTWRLGLLAVAAVLVRPEGVLIPGTAILVLWLAGRTRGRWRSQPWPLEPSCPSRPGGCPTMATGCRTPYFAKVTNSLVNGSTPRSGSSSESRR